MVDFIVLPPPILPAVDPGPDDTICAGMIATLQATVQQCDSLKWSTTGDGVFGNDTLPATTYTPGTNDVFAGNVTCRLTGYGTYGSTSKNKLVRINPHPVAKISVFPHDTVCAGQAINLSADTAGISTWLWTPGNLNTPEVIYDTANAGGLGTHMIRLIVTDRFQCQNRDSVYLRFKNCTGIEENTTSSTRIYPNPGSGLFMIEVNDKEPG